MNLDPDDIGQRSFPKMPVSSQLLNLGIGVPSFGVDVRYIAAQVTVANYGGAAVESHQVLPAHQAVESGAVWRWREWTFRASARLKASASLAPVASSRAPVQ